MDLSSISDEELQEIVRKKLLGTEGSGCTEQKAVCVDEVENYLAQGWESPHTKFGQDYVSASDFWQSPTAKTESILGN